MQRIFALAIVSIIIGFSFVQIAWANPAPVPLPIIKILDNGMIVPQNSPIKQVGSTYSFTSNVYDESIEIQKDNVTIDGAGYNLENRIPNPFVFRIGLNIPERSNITIKNMIIEGFDSGISLQHSNNVLITNVTIRYGAISADNCQYCSIDFNEITGNGGSIILSATDYTNITNNNMVKSYRGIVLDGSSSAVSFVNIIGNNISEGNKAISMNLAGKVLIAKNIIKNCQLAIEATNCTDKVVVYYNDFIDNNSSSQVHGDWQFSYFDNGEQGNYWSNYNGPDRNNDGLGDIPYIIDANNIDHYPLMKSITSGTVSFSMKYPQDFSPTFFLAFVAVAVVAVVAIGLFVYFKKRKH